MAKVVTKGYANTTPFSGADISPIKLGEPDNYAIIEDEAGVTMESNTSTSRSDIAERVSIKAQTLNEVKTSQGVLYPAPVKNGVQYSIKVENVISTTDDADPSYRKDEPIVVTLTVKHNQSETFTSNIVMENVIRAISALYYTDSEGAAVSRIPNLQRLATRPAGY